MPDRFPMLYNLSKDISEQNDVSMQNLDITKSMLKKLGDWDVSQPHPVFLEGAVWKARQLKLLLICFVHVKQTIVEHNVH